MELSHQLLFVFQAERMHMITRISKMHSAKLHRESLEKIGIKEATIDNLLELNLHGADISRLRTKGEMSEDPEARAAQKLLTLLGFQGGMNILFKILFKGWLRLVLKCVFFATKNHI